MEVRAEDDEDALLRILLELADASPSGLNNSTLFPPCELWQCLLRKTSSDNDGSSCRPTGMHGMVNDDSLKSCLSEQWKNGLEQVADLAHALTAFELHASATQALILGVDKDDASGNRSDSNDMLTAVCLLLCCLALQNRVATNSNSSSSPMQRPRRWQSLVFETVRLFQTNVLGTEIDDVEKLHKFWIPLWVDHVLPSTHRAQQNLLSLLSDPSLADASDLLWSLRAEDSAYLSGIVATSTMLARKCGFSTQDPSLLDNVLQSLFFRIELVEGNGDRVLWDHPWRMHYGKFTDPDGSRFRSLQAALFFWTCGSVSEENEDSQNAKKESVSFLETQWDDLGLATLAAVAWDQRPILWSHGYVWKLWFPHVAVLLNADACVDDDNTSQNSCSTVFQLLGYRLLKNLLLCMPLAALTLQGQRQGDSARSRPDDPIGTFQLISNRIVASSVNRGGTMISRSTSSLQASVYPDGTAAFQIMQHLVARYRPIDQVRIVRNLVQNCPHIGLRPKLLDLLRPFVSWDSSGVASVWSFCDEILGWLEKHALFVEGKKSLLINVDELVTTTELYNSCLSMLFLWIRVKKIVPEIPEFVTRLTKFYAALQNTLQLTMSNSTSVAPSVQYHRLYILESTIRQIVESIEEQVGNI